MICPEYLRLRQEYEASLRRWGEARLSQAETAPQLRLKTYQDRYSAKRKLDLHKESCPACDDTWKSIDTLLEKEHIDDDPDDVY
jgi:hypothetical protein